LAKHRAVAKTVDSPSYGYSPPVRRSIRKHGGEPSSRQVVPGTWQLLAVDRHGARAGSAEAELASMPTRTLRAAAAAAAKLAPPFGDLLVCHFLICSGDHGGDRRRRAGLQQIHQLVAPGLRPEVVSHGYLLTRECCCTAAPMVLSPLRDGPGDPS
jgi:hypothetical protein